MKIISKEKGRKPLFPFLGNFSPKVKNIEKFYQKKVGMQLIAWPDRFDPKNYNGTNEEKADKAYQHAKQHEKFYKELIKEGVYPKGTTIKTKKLRHSNIYILEMYMPEVKKIHPEEMHSYWKSNEVSGNVPSKKLERLESEKEEIRNVILSVMKKYGFDYRKIHEDPDYLRNYGIDKDGKLKYFDTGILKEHLPEKNKGKLENKLLGLGMIISSLILILSTTPKINGNTILNFTEKTMNSISLFSFLILIIALSFWLKSRPNSNTNNKNPKN